MSTENIPKFKPPKVEEIEFPSDLTNQSKARIVLSTLFSLATDVVTATEIDRPTRRERFERQIDDYLDHDPDAERFLLTDHPSYGVNWLGYIRHLFGTPVDGKQHLPPRIQPRGVGSRSGKNRLP